MRIYTRGENQSLLIGHNVTVTVLQVFSDRVRLGITMRHDDRGGPPDETLEPSGFDAPGAPTYWETELFLPDNTNLENVELELSLR